MAARAATRDRVERFDQGSVGAVGEKRDGQLRMSAEQIARMFFGGRTSRDQVQQFAAAMGDRPEAVRALKGYAAQTLRDTAVKPDGSIDAKALERWVMRHRTVLDAYPDVASQVADVAKAQGLVDRLAERRERAMADIQKSTLALFLGDRTPQQAVSAVLNGTNPVRAAQRIRAAVRSDPQALAGLQREAIDYLIRNMETTAVDAAGASQQSAAAATRAFNKSREALRVWFPAEHVDNIGRVVADLQSQAWAQRAGTVPGSPTAQNLTTLSLIRSMTGGLLDPQRVPGVLAWPNKLLGMVLQNKEDDVRRVLTEAMMTPDGAAALLAKATPFATRKIGQVLGDAATRLGITASRATTRTLAAGRIGEDGLDERR